MNYQDDQTFWHDKPTNGEPSSNNGFIYTAYSKYLAPATVDQEKVVDIFNKCVESLQPLMVNRLPGQIHPATSKDEIIGMVSLGLLDDKVLSKSHYNFCNLFGQFDRKLTFKSFIKAVKALWKVKQEVYEQKLEGSDKRNYFWENRRVDAYPLAFRLDPADVYYVKKMSGKKPSKFETIYFYINTFTSIISSNKSARMMTWLKLEDLGYKNILKFVDKKYFVESYFGKEHPFYSRNWK